MPPASWSFARGFDRNETADKYGFAHVYMGNFVGDGSTTYPPEHGESKYARVGEWINDGKQWTGIRLTRWCAEGKVRLDVEDGTFDTDEALVRGACFCYTLEPDDEPEAERAQVCARASCAERVAVRRCAVCGLCRRKGPLVEESRYR